MDSLMKEIICGKLKFIEKEVTPENYNKLFDTILQFYHDVMNGSTSALEDYYLHIKGNEQYNLGYSAGYEQRESEYQSEQFDNEQYGWERGYHQGYSDGIQKKESLI